MISFGDDSSSASEPVEDKKKQAAKPAPAKPAAGAKKPSAEAVKKELSAVSKQTSSANDVDLEAGRTDPNEVEKEVSYLDKSPSAVSRMSSLSPASIQRASKRLSEAWNDPRRGFVTHQMLFISLSCVVFLIWIFIRCFDLFGESCYYTDLQAKAVIRADKATEYAACSSVATASACSGDCWWDTKNGMCDLAEFEEAKEFVYWMPSLKTYFVTDLVWVPGTSCVAIAVTMVFWLSVWVWRKPMNQIVLFSGFFGVTILQGISFSNKNDGMVRMLRLAYFIGMNVGLVPCKWMCTVKVPWKIWLRVMAYLSSIAMFLSVGTMYLDLLLRPISMSMTRNDVTGLRRTIVELMLATFFFSILIPLGQKLIARMLMQLLSGIIPLSMKKGGSAARELKKREEFLRPLLNVLFDMYRYGYGRGVLLKLSPSAFVIVVMRDVWYDMLHFGCNYLASFHVFMLKLDQTKGLKPEQMELTWQMRMFAKITSFNRKINRLDIATAISFFYTFDCELDEKQRAAATGDEQEIRKTGTDGKEIVRYNRNVNFANHRIMVRNVPKMEPIPPRNAGVIGDVECEGDMEGTLFPITDADIQLVRPVLEYIQLEVFTRFHVRMVCKFATIAFQYGACIIGLLSYQKHLPGFPRKIERSKDVEVDGNFLFAVTVFFLVDVVTFCVLTFGIHLNDNVSLRKWHDTLRLYMDIWERNCGRFAANMSFLLIGPYFGVLVISRRWESFPSPITFFEATGMQITYDHIETICGKKTLEFWI